MQPALPFREKEASRLPLNWPSYLHNKCSNRACLYANPPQAAEGWYNCQGYLNGSCCQGTYYVSASTAHTVVQNHKEELRREDKAKSDAEIAARKERRRIQAEAELKRLAAAELAAQYKEMQRIENAFAKAPNGLDSSIFLTRRTAQRRGPNNTKPAKSIPEQHQTSSIPDKEYVDAIEKLYSRAVADYCLERPPQKLSVPLGWSEFS